MYPLKLRVAACATCNGPIYIEVADPRDPTWRSSLKRRFATASEAHQAMHSMAASLLNRNEWDTCGLYSIGESLGTAAVYRLWLEAGRMPTS